MSWKVASRDLIERALTPCSAGLIQLGFKRRAGDIFTYPLNADSIGWVGNCRAVRQGDGNLRVSPNCGVRNQRLERTVAELKDRPYHSYIPPSVSLMVGYLMPEHTYKQWIFRDGATAEEIEQQAEDMIRAVKSYGLPMMRANDSLPALYDTMLKYAAREYLAYRQPVASLLMGKPEQAARQVGGFVASLGTRQDEAAKLYRQFAERLRARLASL